jgi:hypothetical protein
MVLDLLSEGKEKLVIGAWRRSPLYGTGAERPEKTMVSSARTPPSASSANKLLLA